jgi:hypothetical protein
MSFVCPVYTILLLSLQNKNFILLFVLLIWHKSHSLSLSSKEHTKKYETKRKPGVNIGERRTQVTLDDQIYISLVHTSCIELFTLLIMPPAYYIHFNCPLLYNIHRLFSFSIIDSHLDNTMYTMK